MDITIYEVLVGLMVFPMILMVILHVLCVQALEQRPQIRHSRKERVAYEWMEGAMAIMCIGALTFTYVYYWELRTICLTDPVKAILAHAIWIVGAWAALVFKWTHYDQLRTMPEAPETVPA